MRTGKWIAISAVAFGLSTATWIVIVAPLISRCPVDDILTKAKQDIRAYSTAVILYRIDHFQIPTDQEGLLILTHPNSQYIDEQRSDPWGTPYFYKVLGGSTSEFSIHSAGPNRIDENGLGDDVVQGWKNYKCSDYNTCRSLADYLVFTITGLVLLSFISLVFFSIGRMIGVIRQRRKHG